MKEITVVFQDCVLCGDRGRKKAKFLEKNGISLRKVSAFSDEGDELVHTAVLEHKIKGLPFYTDGKTFSSHLERFLESKKPEKAPKKVKKTANESDKNN